MPIADIFVDAVIPTTLGPNLTRYLVSGRHTDASLGGFQATTVNGLRASVCDRSKEKHLAVRVWWGDAPQDRWGASPGKRIVDVQLLNSEVF